MILFRNLLHRCDHHNLLSHRIAKTVVYKFQIVCNGIVSLDYIDLDPLMDTLIHRNHHYNLEFRRICTILQHTALDLHT